MRTAKTFTFEFLFSLFIENKKLENDSFYTFSKYLAKFTANNCIILPCKKLL